MVMLADSPAESRPPDGSFREFPPLGEEPGAVPSPFGPITTDGIDGSKPLGEGAEVGTSRRNSPRRWNREETSPGIRPVRANPGNRRRNALRGYAVLLEKGRSCSGFVTGIAGRETGVSKRLVRNHERNVPTDDLTTDNRQLTTDHDNRLMFRTRFAPSPTGYLHIGGVRTALFCWLFARRNQGKFILRIDDTDQQRNVQEALAPILAGLRWLGIDWDEGPEVGGPHGPYYQSQRSALYQAAVDELLRRGMAYRDYATTDEIQTERDAADARETRLRLQPPLDGRNARRSGGASRPKAARPSSGSRCPARARSCSTTWCAAESSSPGRASRTTSSSGPTARASTTWPASSTTTRWRSPTSSAPKSISRTRRARSSSPSRSATNCRNTPICRSSPSRAARSS